MIKKPFREHHLLTLLQEYDAQHLPLDLFISNYFRAHKALGSKDRAYIAETIYGMVRWKGLLDHLCNPDPNWEKKLELYKNLDPARWQNDDSIPLHIRLSFPAVLFNILVKNFGEAQACALCRISNSPAPTTIRVNTLKGTRDEMIERWQDTYSVEPCKLAPQGIIFHKKTNFFTLPEFKAGLFEVQDEGSQLLAGLVQAQPGQWVMDYCAGSGGKTLAFAPAMQRTGQIFLHDIRSFALDESRKRLRRAGIQNAQTVAADDSKLKKLKKKMHWVLVDAPCTGTGTMRRNPDMKWKFTEDTLSRLIGQQRTIFEKALSYMRPDGRIVYATCSLLKEENQDQMERFLKSYDLEREGDVFQVFPSEGGMDGFFGVVFKQKSH